MKLNIIYSFFQCFEKDTHTHTHARTNTLPSTQFMKHFVPEAFTFKDNQSPFIASFVFYDADLSKSFTQLIVSIFYLFSILFFSIDVAPWKKFVPIVTTIFSRYFFQ